MRKFVSAIFCLACCGFLTITALEGKEGSTGGFDKINLNKASAVELGKIPGISSSKAKLIVAYREEQGEFKSIDDLKKISHETKSGKTSLNFATKKGKWTKGIKPLIDAEVFTLKGGSVVVDRNLLYKKLYPKEVDINKASLSELSALPGLSKSSAKKIIDNRPYSSIDDLKPISHETKSGKISLDFATKGGKWKKTMEPLIESKRLICSAPSGAVKKNKAASEKKIEKKPGKKQTIDESEPEEDVSDDDEW